MSTFASVGRKLIVEKTCQGYGKDVQTDPGINATSCCGKPVRVALSDIDGGHGHQDVGALPRLLPLDKPVTA